MAYPCDDAKFHYNGFTYNEAEFRKVLSTFDVQKLEDFIPEIIQPERENFQQAKTGAFDNQIERTDNAGSTKPGPSLPDYTYPEDVELSAFDEPRAKRLQQQMNKLASQYSKLITGAEKTEFNAERINGARFRREGNELFANPDMMELLRQAHGQTFQRGNQETFFGAYQNPVNTEDVGQSLRFGVLGGDYDFNTRERAKILFKVYEDAVKSSPYKDTRIIATSKEMEYGLVIARQEENAHQADYRVGAEHSIGVEVMRESEDGREGIENLRSGAYQGASVNLAAMELTAKLFVPSETQTGLSKEQKLELRKQYYLKLSQKGVNSEDIEREFAPISETGKEFSNYAKQYEREQFQRNSGIGQTINRTAASADGFGIQGAGAARGAGLGYSNGTISGQSGNFGTGFLEPTGSANGPQTSHHIVRIAFDEIVREMEENGHLRIEC